MKTPKRTFAVLAAAAMGLLGVAATATPAAASPWLNHTATIKGNYDTGSHGIWAKLDYKRSVAIKPVGLNKYKVALTDTGTFSTIPGKHSPRNNVTLQPANGTFVGEFAFDVTSTTQPTATGASNYYNFNCNTNGTGDRVTDCTLPTVGGTEIGTSGWPKLFFPNGAVTAGNWTWTYKTDCEKWVNSNAGDSGDITGKRCGRDDHGHDNNDHGHDDHGNDHGDSHGHDSHGNDHGHDDHGHNDHKPIVKPVYVKPLYVRQGTCPTKGIGTVTPPHVSHLNYYLSHKPLTHTVKLSPGDYSVAVVADKGYKPVGQVSRVVRMHKPICLPIHGHSNH